MKKAIYLIFAALAVMSCTGEKVVNVIVANGTATDRNNEIVEVSMDEVSAKLQLADTAQFIVVDEANQQIPYQITYDDMIIFPASVKANGKVVYSIKAGTPIVPDMRACGRFYPERVDDVAWENDRTAFRTYGPALQANGEKACGRSSL